MIKRWLGWNIILYLMTGIALYYWASPLTASLTRLNALSSFADYPIDFSKKEQAADFSRLRGALRYYSILAHAYPQTGRGDEMMGYCYFLMKDYRQSQKSFEKALKIKPQYFWLKYNLALIAYQQGDQKTTAKYLNDIINIDEKEQVLAAAISSLKKLQEAERNAMFSLLPDFVARVRNQAGFIFYQKALGIDSRIIQPFLVPVLHPWSYKIPPGKEMLFN